MPITPSRLQALFSAFALSVIALSAAQQQAPNQDQPRFRAATTLIQVDAIVRDKDGRFVADLTADDFEVREDGAPQSIETFFVVTRPGGPAPATAPAAPAVPPPSPAPPPQQTQRIFVLFFDQEHMAPGNFERARSGAEQFLAREFQPGDIGGIVNGGTMVKNRLTSDREELLADVKAVKPTADSRSRQLDMREWPRFLSEYELWRVDYGDDQVLGQVAARALADDPTLARDQESARVAVQQKARRLVADLRAAGQRTLQSVRGLADGLARLPGRKTIVFLSDGFFAEDAWGDLRGVIGSAARASVRVYTIDTRGLNRGSASSDIFETGPHAAVDPGGTPPSFDIGIDAPNSLAVDSGGLAIRNENDFARAFRRIADDTSSYYILGYRPANASFDGKFRRIAVRVKRPGLAVRARRGYLATAEPVPATELESAVPAPATAGPGAPPSGAPKGEAPPVGAPTPPPATPPRSIPGTTAEGTGVAVRMRPHVGEEVTELEKRTSAAESGAGTTALPDALIRQAREGWDAYQRGDVQQAKASLSPAAAHPAAPPWVHYVLGWSEFALAEYASASASWERVRHAVPEFEPVYFDLADSYLQRKEFGRALAILRDAERRWPTDVEVFNALGVTQIGRGALNDAIQTFEKGIAVKPDDPTVCYNLARAYELRFAQGQLRGRQPLSSVLQDHDRAVDYYRRTIQLGGPLVDSAREGLKRLGAQ